MDVDDDDDNNDADCAICYRIKKFPVDLQCGHSYFLPFIHKVHTYSHANMQSFQCPYCRRQVSVPPSMTISSSLQYYLKSKSPWLQYKSSNTLGEILMALAAGTGSVFILEYLITQHNIDPLTTLYANGRNLMHVAASRPNLVSCKWLCCNGYLELATHLSDENLSPAHEAIKNSNYAASFVFDLFSDHEVLPDNWIDLASVSLNASILIGVIEKSTLGKCDILDDNVITQFELIIQYGRVDILFWLYSSDLERQSVYFNEERRELIHKKLIGGLNSNRGDMEVFMNYVEVAEKLRWEIANCDSGFKQMILDGAPVVKIENMIKHQKELIKKAKNLLLDTDYLEISFDGIVQHGLNPLETAVHRGYLHLIGWILKMPDKDATEAVTQILTIYSRWKHNCV
ncbi:hypothetical protein GOP47_0024348 [Adiantum capillus-veneris]|uniref:RING-type domain-containing protein n=1 Tax=Adiantum capillus-veneris TaxID=13818 RepID=A0A9D4U2R8_ADICA|nr:hypothetical protein GOP47_0024348 [Adiantum capillus-veneris]